MVFVILSELKRPYFFREGVGTPKFALSKIFWKITGELRSLSCSFLNLANLVYPNTKKNLSPFFHPLTLTPPPPFPPHPIGLGVPR
jgi:hypothetical protein